MSLLASYVASCMMFVITSSLSQIPDVVNASPVLSSTVQCYVILHCPCIFMGTLTTGLVSMCAVVVPGVARAGAAVQREQLLLDAGRGLLHLLPPRAHLHPGAHALHRVPPHRLGCALSFTRCVTLAHWMRCTFDRLT